MAPTAKAEIIVPSRTPYKPPIVTREATVAMTTLLASKPILHFGKGHLDTLATASTIPSPGSVRKLAFTCKNTPNAVIKQPTMLKNSCVR